MGKWDWLDVGLKLLGVYFGVSGVASLGSALFVLMVAANQPGTGGVGVVGIWQPAVELVAAFLLVCRTSTCLLWCGEPEPASCRARWITSTARDAATRAGRLMDLWREYHDKVGLLTRAGAAVRLVDLLFTRPFITIPIAMEFLGQTYPAAQNNVEKLVEANILKEMSGTSNPKVFMADAILRLLDDPPNDAG